MKKIPALIVICLTIVSAFSSCRRSATQQETSAADSLNTELSDSLATAMAEKDSLMALMSDISDGMNQKKPVSYTHPTLPTKRIEEHSGVGRT